MKQPLHPSERVILVGLALFDTPLPNPETDARSTCFQCCVQGPDTPGGEGRGGWGATS